MLHKPLLSSCSGPHVSSDHLASVLAASVFTSSVLLVCSACLLPQDLVLLWLKHSLALFPLLLHMFLIIFIRN